ncbi:diacylglycerol/lipid kinase family protein [Massilimicrobiota timonensis]|uniref:diacylglycerol/lipid kinase family protein n=1 Tax=Massilimicrobiota timonensis TaxID=1776392 RepID=UPI00101D9028|nr:diacylglycerol kinase family protein [Massilimicrobiota timonensis]
MKCLFIINPSAGTKTIQKKLDQIIGQMILKKLVSTIDVFYTEKKDDAYQYCLKLKDDDYDFVVSVGGDGTVNEIINGFIENHLQTPLAILPGGTVNDFANHLHLPHDTDDFIQMIEDFQIMKVDIGKVNEHYFANVIAGGMFSDISFQVSKADKERFGPLAYYISGIRQLPTQLHTSLHLKITADDQTFEEDAKLFIITNTSQVGGFKDITPHANVQDGQLDLLIIKNCSTTDLISLFKDYKLNNHEKSPFITYVQAKELTIACDKDIIYDVDGEKGTTFPIHVSVKKQSLCVIIPKEKTRE